MITLKLKIDDVDSILTALGDQPYVKVADIINKIRQQALPQFEAMKKEEENILVEDTSKDSI